jgi:NAD(P)-dependent dehydrogenase (short-subunit alcohol dehydrogenase family)
MATKRALVTGCSTGIGRATALELTARGWEVVATARRPESVADLGVARTLLLDVDSDASVAAARDAVGPVDVLVNNAGFGIEGPVEEVPLDEARRAMETNFFGAARMVQAFLPAMREQGSGWIVNVTSVAGVVAPPLGGFYAATKFALEALSEALHLEVGHFGVRVLIVEPGGIETAFGPNMADFRGRSGPYKELADLWDGALGTLRGGEPSPGAEVVAAAICDALESDDPPLRVPVGTDARLITSTRDASGYADFETAMRQVLQFDW